MKFQVGFDVTMTSPAFNRVAGSVDAVLETVLGGAAVAPARVTQTRVRVWLGRCRAMHLVKQDWRLEVPAVLREGLQRHLANLGDVVSAAIEPAMLDALHAELEPRLFAGMETLGVVANEIESPVPLPPAGKTAPEPPAVDSASTPSA